MGSKYQFKVNDVPPPGTYEWTKADESTRKKSPSAKMTNPYIADKDRKPKDPGPEPYDGHLKGIGEGQMAKVGFGSKYEFKVNDVPPPGTYDWAEQDDKTRERSPAAKMREPFLADGERKQGESSPGPYDVPPPKMNNIDFGAKYDHKYSDVPPPWHYDPKHRLTEERVPEAHIDEPTPAYELIPPNQSRMFEVS